ncbi:esterase [Listeria floridensis FSL S10-1187]|uniref:Esterase n=1 Tax=Listeria floridensis FSL S10-1187 TaxID=1265817 RepID=A0ABN0RFM0_9LIST|nr:alpha/beta hydrolase-fold protein [Listeria floridensis]EUJ32202.1 esterase [Listeria floridensis FSL S10-1187]
MAEGKMLEEKLFSKHLNEEMEVIIYLPPQYSPLYKYPLFIVQDGKDYIRFGKMPKLVDELTQTNEIQKSVFAFLPYKTVEDRRRKYHPDGDQNEAYIRFLADELVPFLENLFPSFQMAGSRFLMGDSLGASVSLKACLEYPYTFGNAILHSPFVNDDLLNMTQNAKPGSLKLFHIVGDQENEVETTAHTVDNFLEPNQKLNQVVTEKGFEATFQLFQGGHRWTYWQPFLKPSLTYMLPTNTFDLESMSS